jgi:hypothetical protein
MLVFANGKRQKGKINYFDLCKKMKEVRGREEGSEK